MERRPLRWSEKRKGCGTRGSRTATLRYVTLRASGCWLRDHREKGTRKYLENSRMCYARSRRWASEQKRMMAGWLQYQAKVIPIRGDGLVNRCVVFLQLGESKRRARSVGVALALFAGTFRRRVKGGWKSWRAKPANAGLAELRFLPLGDGCKSPPCAREATKVCGNSSPEPQDGGREPQSERI